MTQTTVGSVHGRLTVIASPFKGKSGLWTVRFVECRCECGAIRTVRLSALRSGHTSSCGCLHRENHTKHGMAHTSLYDVWESMLARCRNPKHRSWQHYGGRGISVCREWIAFEPFMEWAIGAGYADGLSIDRINNDGNYEPSNCRWATRSQQCRNQRTSRPIAAFGESKPLCDWVKDPRCVVSLSGMYHRIRKGWKPEDAITTIGVRTP